MSLNPMPLIKCACPLVKKGSPINLNYSSKNHVFLLVSCDCALQMVPCLVANIHTVCELLHKIIHHTSVNTFYFPLSIMLFKITTWECINIYITKHGRLKP